MNKSVLILSDMHMPFSHPDIIAFLKAVKRKYKPDKVICIGDEFDFHAISMHPTDPDLLSPSDELKTARNRIKPVFGLFPKVDVVESNHGSLVYRRAKVDGLPRYLFKNYRDVLGAPKGWKWHNDLTIRLSNGASCYFVHSKGADILKVSQAMGMSVVCGHHHEKFEVRYWANSLGLYFGMIVGCLIDDDSLAFAYNKINLKRPLIGCGIIMDGIPQLIPLIMKKGGRWSGVLP